MREAGVPVPDSVLLNASTMQNKKDLIEAIEQEKSQAMEMQNAQMQTQIELQQAQIESYKAQAAANQGLGLERISRVEENEALAIERRAQAVRDEDAGLLDKIKALKEIETLDITHLKELIAMSQLLKTDVSQTSGAQHEDQQKLKSQVSRSSQPQGMI